jgi:RNA recognition motif. (a.k.a. RRM, RBD, or RNP domain)
MAALAAMQAMLPSMAGMLPPMSPPFGRSSLRERKQRCRDYDNKGYCILGNSCPYEHGNDLIVALEGDEYDPTRANFSMNDTRNGAPTPQRPARRRRRPASSSPVDVRRNNRAPFSDPRLPPDRNFTTIVVEQIPEDNFEEDTVHRYFSQFGKVLEVTMKAYKRLAIIKFETHSAAKRAWENPKAIFDNRFVKVYWHRPDLAEASGHIRQSSAQNHRAAVVEDCVDLEEFRQQQEEKQKAYEEKGKIRKAMEDARQDLIRRREQMAKEYGALVKRLAAAEGHEEVQINTNGTKEPADNSVGDAPNPKIKALREQLAKMQAEAKSLGIDPDARLHDTTYPFSGRGRGRGGTFRGGYTPRSAYRGYGSTRGGYRGHGFVRGRDPSVKKLDNRPKNIVVSGIDFDNGKEEHLRSYLTLIGPFEDIELNPQRPDTRIIVFQERWHAEQLMHGRTDIPGVGQVELSWVANTLIGGTARSSSRDEDEVLQDAAAEEGGRMFSDEAQQHQQRDDNLDVAGGDDDDWGNIL